MKKVLFKSSILLLLFTLASIYFAIFNWQIFIVRLNINLGFGVVEFPPFVLLILISFIIIAILSWSNYMIRLKKMIYELEYGVEMGKMRDKLTHKRVKELLTEEKNLDLLKEKMGIEEIRKKQEELKKLVQEMKEKTEEKE